MARLPDVELAGVRLDNLTADDVVDHVASALAAGRGGCIVTPNVDIVRRAARDPQLRRLLHAADLSLPDGMPLVWASRLRRTPLQARLAMSELIYPLARSASRHRHRLFLLGDTDDVASAAAAALAAAAPGLRIVGTHSPPFGFDASAAGLQPVTAALEAAGPDLVICAFGFPRQERLMAALRPRFPATWFVAAGATLSMAAGRTPPAPPWMRRRGLEWLHRLRLEPRRLFHRYVVDDAPFAVRLLAASAVQGWLAPRTADLTVRRP